jgi:hypothetical protein
MSSNFNISYREDTAIFQNLWVKTWMAILVLLMIVSPFFLNRYQLSILNEAHDRFTIFSEPLPTEHPQ